MILQYLVKHDASNYYNALMTIPFTLKKMYVHSFQSYMWNKAVSFRLSKFPKDKVIAGDLVLI